MKLKSHVIIIILLMWITLFVGVGAANSSNQKDTTYYASLEPDLEGNAYFHIHVQNFNHQNSRIFGIGMLISVENCTSVNETTTFYDLPIITPDANIDVLYNDGQIETVNYYEGELIFLGNDYCDDYPIPSQMYYINVTDKIRQDNITDFDIKFYDSSYNSEKHYNLYPFDNYLFVYDIIFLNESNVMLSVSPSNPNNFYEINVSLNHTYKDKYGFNYEEQVNKVYDGIYKTNFKTEKNELVDRINIIYTRKTGLPKISFYVLFILMISMLIIFPIVFKNKIPRELNATIFGTFLTIYTFSSSIGYSYRPTWLKTASYFDILFIIDLIFIIAYFIILVIKWNECPSR